MSRALILLYAILCYILFFATFLYFIAFIENVPILADYGFTATVSDGIANTPILTAIAINLGLITLFGLQHSIMARRWFKKAWIKVVPAAAERSTYVLLTSLILILLFFQWRTIPNSIWMINNNIAAAAIYALSGTGWGIVLLSTFLLGHFSLFGVAQAWANMRGKTLAAPSMREPMLYKYMRHPLYFGFLLAFWATPRMTLGHMVLALGFTLYILIAVRYEESDLAHELGAQYSAYRKRVSMLIPMPPRRP